MSAWRWLRDFADRRINGKGPARKEPPAQPPPPRAQPPRPAPPLSNPDDLLRDLYAGLGLGGVTRTIRTTLMVTAKCATCGTRNRVDMGRPGTVRRGACGLPLRVTVTK